MDFKELQKTLEYEERELQFLEFTNETALTIGMNLVSSLGSEAPVQKCGPLKTHLHVEHLYGIDVLIIHPLVIASPLPLPSCDIHTLGMSPFSGLVCLL